ncbi:hypothetical protein ACFLV7_01335 [Chloroflexota bacterium]
MKRLLQIAGSFTTGFILYRTLMEFYLLAPSIGPFLGKLTIKWGIAFLSLAVFDLLVFLIILLAIWNPEELKNKGRPLIKLREWLGLLRWPIAIAALVLPAYLLLYTQWGSIFTGPCLRLMLLLTSSLLFALVASSGESHLLTRTNFFFGMLLTGSVFAMGDYLTNVTNYPFTLSWSEGNRLYDYSMYFGSDRYTFPGKLTNPFFAPGRHMLWGIVFLISDTPIWLHRLWDAILWTIPYFLLGFLIARWGTLGGIGKLMFSLWVFLFLTQGPIYTPLILSALLIVIFVHPSRWLLSLLGVVLASFYAASSRYTWFAAPVTWTVLILLSAFNINRAEKFVVTLRRIMPIALISFAGLAAAVIAYPQLIIPQELTTGSSFSQPLLWFRLLPNATYNEGIILGIITKTIPLITLLVWLIVSKQWKLNWIQKFTFIGSAFAFLMIGLIISVKIGGGNNLHNLDMYLVTLVILSGLMLKGAKKIFPSKWPLWAQGVLVLAMFLPSWNSFNTATPLQLPLQNTVANALEAIQTEVEKAKLQGEILFIDQRQLLTFDFIQDVQLVSEYDKKLLMEQAMANNFDYFQEFYEDLAGRQFSLIVSNPLSRKKQYSTDSFAEENNAWVKWVARPVLCYYKPIYTSIEVRIQLLVPRATPKNCPKYIYPP